MMAPHVPLKLTPRMALYWRNLQLPLDQAAARQAIGHRIGKAQEKRSTYIGLHHRAATLLARTGKPLYEAQADMYRNSALREDRRLDFLWELLDFVEGRG